MIETKTLDKIMNFSFVTSLTFTQFLLYLPLLLGSLASIIIAVHLYPDDITPFYELIKYASNIIYKLALFFLVVALICAIFGLVASLINKEERRRVRRKEEFNIYLENKIKEMKNARSKSRK